MAFFDIDEYGLGRPRNLFDYATILDEEEEEKRRSNKPMIPYTGADLSQYSPTQFDVPDIASALTSTAPTGINPAAPAESQPPAIDVPVTVQDKYERMEGVTNSDRLAALGMSMSAIGTTDFNRIYGASNAALIKKQREADEYNMDLERGTKPTTEVSGNNIITYAPLYTRNSDGTYSVHPDAGKVLDRKSATAGLEGLTDQERAIVEGLTGDNGDTMKAYILGKNAGLVPEDMAFDQFVSDPLNSNQGETSKSFNRNAGILMDQGYTRGQAQSLAMLAENGGLEIVRNADTGEIKAIDPVTQESFVIEDYQTGLQKIVEAAGSTQDAKNRSDLDKEQVTTITTRLNDYRGQLGQIDKSDEVTSYWIDQLQAKDANDNYVIDYEKDFGWLNSLMSDYFGIASPEFSGLSADAIYEALQNLDITNLAPVSNFEFKQVMKLFADGKLATREQALAVLGRAQARAEREREEYRNKFDNDLDSLNRIQGDDGTEYLNYSGMKTWITDDEARKRYRRPKQ